MAPAAKVASFGKKRKKRVKKKMGPRQLNLKGWFKGPEDWEDFYEWAEVKAKPRKLPEPEPLPPRPHKHLKLLLRRIKTLSQPPNRPTELCKLPTISRGALSVKPSKRTCRLAEPNKRQDSAECRDLGVSRAALRYNITPHLCLLSQPKPWLEPDDCRSSSTRLIAGRLRKFNSRMELLAQPKQYEPNLCSFEKKKRNIPELNAWMKFLAIPKYMFLRELDTELANKYKEQYLCEFETRGKQAYEEQLRKRAEEQQREWTRQCREEIMARRRFEEELKLARSKTTLVTGRSSKTTLATGKSKTTLAAQASKTTRKTTDADDDKAEEDDGEENQEVEMEYGQFDVADSIMAVASTIAQSSVCSHWRPPICYNRYKPVFETDPEKMEKRKKEKEAWRYVALPLCRDKKISRAALNYQATDNICLMAKPKKRPDTTCRDISKIKQPSEATARILKLAEPKYQSEPVQRQPPRELDEYGRPIIPKPCYGKVLPEVPPYKPRPCPGEKREEDHEEEEEQVVEYEEEEMRPKKKKHKKRKKQIDIELVYGPTIDPIFDPRGARKQAKARKLAAKMGGLHGNDTNCDDKKQDQDDNCEDDDGGGADKNDEKNDENEEKLIDSEEKNDDNEE